jgi:lipopolysaccharide export system ATP-binding protein
MNPPDSKAVSPHGGQGLIAERLSKTLRRRQVVRDVSFSVQQGEVVGLLGPNGAGKTTSFYMVVGLIGSDHGQVTLNGHDITDLPMHARARLGLGYLPQEPSVFRKLTVERNLLAVLETRPGLSRADRALRAASLLRELGIAHLHDTPALALSGGERRRLEIARALAVEPRFMLLDEPFAGVDPIAVGEIKRIVGHLRERNIGILITDHNVRETLDICDHAYIINEGQVFARGTPEALLQNSEVRAVYLGEHFTM